MDDDMGGDFVWQVQTVNDILLAGAEKKRIGELCSLMISTKRHLEQLERMKYSYDILYLIIEGQWRYGESGYVEELVPRHGLSGRKLSPGWFPMIPSTTNRSLRKHLIGLEHRFGLRVKLSMDVAGTGHEVTDLVEWHNKPLESHESVMTSSSPFHITGRWGLAARMYKEFQGSGFVMSRALAKKYSYPAAFSEATIEDLAEMKVPVGHEGKARRVGEKLAKKLIDQWHGRWKEEEN